MRRPPSALQPAPGPDSGHHVPRAAKPRDASPSDYDLERLEASLRWLQRQEAATRLAVPPSRRPGAPPLSLTRAIAVSAASGSSNASGRRSRSSPNAWRRPSPVAICACRSASWLRACWRRRRSTTFSPLVGPIADAWPRTANGVIRLESRRADVVARRPAGTLRRWLPGATILPASPQNEPFSQRTAPPPPARSSEGETLAMLQPGVADAPATSPREADRDARSGRDRASDAARRAVHRGRRSGHRADRVPARRRSPRRHRRAGAGRDL